MPEALRLRAGGHELEALWIGPKPHEAPTLVFLHEGLGCVGMWRDFPEQLAAETGLGALVYSRQGYGASEPIAPPRPLDYMQKEGESVLPEVLDAAGVSDAILVGHSDGASIAIVHAGTARSRPRVRALILEAPHVFCEDLSVRSIELAKQAFLTGDLKAKLEKYHGENAEGAFWGWNRAWLDPEFRLWNIESYLSGVVVPTLVIQGGGDPYGTLAQVDAIERGVRGPFERAILAGVGHSPHKESTVVTRDLMTAFATRVVG